MPDPLALYAAVVATAGVGWQIYRERRRLKTDLRVEFEHLATPRAVGVMWSGDTDPRPDPLEYELVLQVINDGETTQHVRELFIEDAAETGGYSFVDGDGDKELVPRGRVLARVRTNRFKFDPAGGFYGHARLASGRVLKSKLTRLDMGIVEHIEGHNVGARP